MYAKAVMDLVSDRGEYVLTLPGEQVYYQGATRERISALAIEASPWELARELFFLEDWQKISKNDIVIVSEAEDGSSIELLLKPGKHSDLYRQITFEANPWRMVTSELHSNTGEIIAETTYSDFEDYDGIWIARTAQTRFPGNGGIMEFHANSIQVNDEIEAAHFDVEQAVQDVVDKEYQRQ